MSSRVHPDTQWVHEEDYGEPAFGSIFVGLVLVLVGIVQAIVGAVRNRRP